MSRIYSTVVQRRGAQVQPLLDRLAAKNTPPEVYRDTMFELGKHLGSAILDEISDAAAPAYLACTAEDADFLAKGILTRLEDTLAAVGFSCLWNQRVSPFGLTNLAVAPVVREYKEPLPGKVQSLIVAKSIVSSGCVVRSNLLHLIGKIDPDVIFVTAPVIHSESEARLRQQFEPAVYDKFRFVYFAKDDERTPDGEVVPGVGGMVYERLGIGEQISESRYIPEIVKTRRARLVNA